MGNFRYKNLSFFCFYCGLIGHGERSCEKKMCEAKNGLLCEGQYGEWLGAVNTRFNSKARSSGKRNISSFSNFLSKVLGMEGHGRDESGRTAMGVTNERINSEKKIDGELEEASILVKCRANGIGELEPN